MIFTKSYDKILELIYNNPGIRLNELIKRARISVDTAKNRLNVLLNSKIIKEKRIVSGKKILLKNFFPNLNYEEGKYTFSLVEIKKKNDFFNKNPKLINPFSQLIREIGDDIDIILVFGSFANYSQTKDSDLDLLLLTNKKINKNQIKKSIERSFITFDYQVSARTDSIKNFKKNKDIYETIKDNHIIIFGTLKFIENIKKEAEKLA